MKKDEVSLLDIVLTILKHRKFLLKFVFIITVFALILSLIWPKTYKSTVRFFPPSTEKMGITSLFNSFIPSASSASQLNSEAMLFVLRSRSLKEIVINKFRLDKVYNVEIIEHLLLILESNIKIDEVREGGFGFNPVVAVEFSFFDEDPHRCEAITSFYISQLDSILIKLNYERSFSTFETVKKRYLENIEDLKDAEDALKKFQEEYGIFEIESQLKTMIENIAVLKSESIQLDIELNIMKKNFSTENAQYQNLVNRKSEIDNKYKQLVQKSNEFKSEKLFHPLSNMPDLIKKYGRLYREVIVQGKIYEVTFPQYEQLRIDLNATKLGIQILDYAKLPTYKDKPKRAVIVIVGFLFSILLSLLIIYLKESIKSGEVNGTDDFKKWITIKNILASDVKFWKKHGN